MQLGMPNAIPSTTESNAMLKRKPNTPRMTIKPTKPTKTAKAPKYTARIRILGVGTSASGERFLKIAVGENTALLNVDLIGDAKSVAFKTLTRLGNPLIMPIAQKEFVGRAHYAAGREPTFSVVTKTGWFGEVFVLPVGLTAASAVKVEHYFDLRYAQYHRRLHKAGKPKGWLELATLCRGKTRLMAALMLNFTGTVCAAFGFEPSALQFVSEGGLGKTTIGKVTSTVWGGDKNPLNTLGCGVAWNNTTLNLEVIAAAFNQMCLFLNDMHNSTKEHIEAIIELMNGEGRGRLTETQRVDFCTPIVSTSNTSVIALARNLGVSDQYEALMDRMIDIDLPSDCPYFFEGIETPDELREFGDQLRTLSRQHFGLAGPKFVARLEESLKANRPALQNLVDNWQRQYRSAAAAIKSLGGRELTRLGDKFAICRRRQWASEERAGRFRRPLGFLVRRLTWRVIVNGLNGFGSLKSASRFLGTQFTRDH
jgi:Domain of unknown function (DUF927)